MSATRHFWRLLNANPLPLLAVFSLMWPTSSAAAGIELEVSQPQATSGLTVDLSWRASGSLESRIEHYAVLRSEDPNGPWDLVENEIQAEEAALPVADLLNIAVLGPATATITVEGTVPPGDSFTADGHAFTSMASGPNGFDGSTTPEETAATIVEVVNRAGKQFTAKANKNVVTLTAVSPGESGNLLTLEVNSKWLDGSGSTFTGGKATPESPKISEYLATLNEVTVAAGALVEEGDVLAERKLFAFISRKARALGGGTITAVDPKTGTITVKHWPAYTDTVAPPNQRTNPHKAYFYRVLGLNKQAPQPPKALNLDELLELWLSPQEDGGFTTHDLKEQQDLAAKGDENAAKRLRILDQGLRAAFTAHQEKVLAKLKATEGDVQIPTGEMWAAYRSAYPNLIDASALQKIPEAELPDAISESLIELYQLNFQADSWAWSKQMMQQGLATGRISTIQAVRTTGAVWNTIPAYLVLMGIILITGILMMVFTRRAQRGEEMYIRRMPGIDAIEEGIGRATEMGKPVLYVPGIDELQDIQTIASMLILGQVAKTVAEYQADLIVTTAVPIVREVADEVVRAGYYQAGYPDAFRPQDIRFISSDQFAFCAGTNGIIHRQKPATNIYLGRFFAESLILAETGYINKSIQIAGTAEATQLPFFVAACDYTLIGEELFAVSAYLSRDPRLVSSLKASDYLKVGIVALLLAGTLAASVGNTLLIDLFTIAK